MILVVDNYDSFTWNLVHYLQELGSEVEVVRNDAISAGQALSSGAQAFLISPAPARRPRRASAWTWSPPLPMRGGRCWACAWAIRRSANISAGWSSVAG